MQKRQSKISVILEFVLLTAVILSVICFLKYLILEFVIGNNTEYANKFFTLTPIMNTGAAFSILTAHTQLLIYLSVFVLVGISFWVVYYSLTLSKMELISVSLLSAGVILNLFERATLGYVIDYIKLNFISFPIFNFSDVAIVLGAFLYIIILYSKRD